jgi:HlyD family secretion protein
MRYLAGTYSRDSGVFPSARRAVPIGMSLAFSGIRKQEMSIAVDMRRSESAPLKEASGGAVTPLPIPKREVPRRRSFRWLIWTSLCLLLVLAAAGGVFLYRSRGSGKPVRYETGKVDYGRIVARVTASGTLSALVTVQVGSQVSGRIQELLVDFNARVKKGQVIARIDPRLFEAALAQARANRAAALGNLKKAQAQSVDAHRQYLRSRSLYAQRFIARSEFDTAETTYHAAVAQVSAAQGALEQARAAEQHAQINLAYTTIISPIDGVVISRNVDVGQTVAATLQAPTLFAIAEDLTRMQVDTSVAESDVGKLREGMTASFTVDAYGSTRFVGTVRQVRNAPQTVQNVVTYDAVIDVQNPELRLRPGMTANVTFVYAEKAHVLRVPNSALRFRAPPSWSARAPVQRREEASDRRLVWVLRGTAPAPVPIRIGISDGSFTELTEGDVREQDLLITDADSPSAAPAAMRRVL